MRILIVGPFGQDAKCIYAQLSKVSGNELYGITNRTLENITNSAAGDLSNVRLLSGDLSKNSDALKLLNDIKPDVIFHLAAVHGSSATMKGVEENLSSVMWECHFEITKNIIDWIFDNPRTKFVFAGSSQIFLGLNPGEIVSENSQPSPVNEYGKTKLAAWDLIKSTRDTNDLLLSCAILFNHTSEFSKPEFLFPEIASQISSVLKGHSRVIKIMHPHALIDISSAHDIARGMILMSGNQSSDDFVLGSGKAKSIYSIVSGAIQNLQLNFQVEIEATASENALPCLISNPSKAKNILSWEASEAPENLLLKMVSKLHASDFTQSKP